MTAWSTLASMEFVVVTRSARPPPSSAPSCVKTAGTSPRLSPSRLSKPKCWYVTPKVSLALADRLGALGQDGPEAQGRTLEDPKRAVEGVGEARGGRGQGHGGQLAGQGDVELGELRLERAVEVRGVGAAVGQPGLAVHLQAVRPVEPRDQESQLARVLGRDRRARAERDHRQQRSPASHGHSRAPAGSRGNAKDGTPGRGRAVDFPQKTETIVGIIDQRQA